MDNEGRTCLPHPRGDPGASPGCPREQERCDWLACSRPSCCSELQDSFSSSACRTPRSSPPTRHQVSPCTRPCCLLDLALPPEVQASVLPWGQGRGSSHQPQCGGTVVRPPTMWFWPLTSDVWPVHSSWEEWPGCPSLILVVASGETKISGSHHLSGPLPHDLGYQRTSDFSLSPGLPNGTLILCPALGTSQIQPLQPGQESGVPRCLPAL